MRNVSLLQQSPTDQQVADREQETHRCEPDFVYLRWVFRGGHQVTGQGGGHRFDVVERGTQQLGMLAQRLVAVFDGVADLRCDMLEGFAAVADDLAEEEIQRLDRGGALVERIDFGVADVLLDGVIGQKA